MILFLVQWIHLSELDTGSWKQLTRSNVNFCLLIFTWLCLSRDINTYNHMVIINITGNLHMITSWLLTIHWIPEVYKYYHLSFTLINIIINLLSSLISHLSYLKILIAALSFKPISNCNWISENQFSKYYHGNLYFFFAQWVCLFF